MIFNLSPEKNAHKREKTLDLLTYILEGTLEEKKRKYEEYKKKIDSFVVTHRARDKKKKKERKLDALRDEIEKDKGKVEDLRTKIDSLRSDINTAEENLLETLEEEFNVQVQE